MITNEFEQVVRDWEIPITGDKDAGIRADRVGDSYIMRFTGTRQELISQARSILKVASEGLDVARPPQ